VISFCQTHPVDHYILKWQPPFVFARGQSISILAKPVGRLEHWIIAHDPAGSQCQILRNNRSAPPEPSDRDVISSARRRSARSSRGSSFLLRRFSVHHGNAPRAGFPGHRYVGRLWGHRGQSPQDTQERRVITRATDHYPDGAAEPPGRRVVLLAAELRLIASAMLRDGIAGVTLPDDNWRHASA